MSPSFSPMQFPPCLPPSFSLVHIFVFAVDFSSWWIQTIKFDLQIMKLLLKVNNLESYVSIVQLHLPGEDYRRRLRQRELSFGGNNSYTYMITTVKHALFNFASDLANGTRLKELLRSSGLGGFTAQTTLLTLPVRGNQSTRRKSTTVG